MPRRLLVSLLPLALTLACSGDKDGGTTDTGTPSDSIDVELTVAPGPISGLLVATVTTSEAADVQIVYGVDGVLDQQHPDTSTGTEHTFTLLGLPVDTDVTVQAIAEPAGDPSVSEEVVGHTDGVESEVPTFDAITNDVSLTCHEGGYLLLVWVKGGHSGVTIIDRDGAIVWSLPLIDVDVQASRARVGSDGHSITYTVADAFRTDLVGEVVVQPIDGSAPVVTSAPTAHHDYVQLPDGRLAWLGYAFGDYTCEDEAVIADTAVDTIEEADPGGASTLVYDMFDDYPHPLDCDAGNAFFLPFRFDLTHSNSLLYRPSDDAYFHMLRWHDALVKVDRSTGSYQWQLGGTNDDFSPAAGQNPDDLFTHGHMSDLWNGGFLVFDNNDPGPSWVREYDLDESARTWELVWSWNTEAFELLLGDARRIPDCDNVLVTQSTTGVVREMLKDGAGTTAWMVEAEEGTIVTRVEFIPDLYDLSSAALPE